KVTEVYNNHSDDADVDAKVDMLKTFINDSNNLIHVLFLVAVGYLAVVVIIWILLLRRDRAVIKNERDFWYATITQLQTVIVGGIKSSDSCQGVADKSKVSSNQKQKASDGCTLPEDDS
ncbi:MAG: hypothetical protein Q4P66_03045, partial [Actinomycetaceae bacterium]|nr:hypothetical protein [Actinomycetaceae bacterium]